MSGNLAEIERLCISFRGEDGRSVEAVKGVSFSIGREKLGIVGESGSGKSLSCRALMGVLPPTATVRAQRLEFGGIDLLTASNRVRRGLRGSRMSMILQDPKFSLNPVVTVGRQIIEAIRLGNSRLSTAECRQKALESLEAVRIRAPDRVFGLYPHELSGGMGQRVMIAMMIVREPELLIADEPTSALDVTVQAQVLDIMNDLVQRRGMGLVMISHDLTLVSRFCDRVLVMYAGRIVETLHARALQDARHPYTRGLLACMPHIDGPLTPLPTLERNAHWGEDHP